MPRKGLRKHFSAAANVCTLGIYVFSWRGCGKSSSYFWGSVEKALGGESGAFLWYLSYAVDVMQSIAEYCNGPVQRESCIHRLVSALKLTSFFFSPFPSSLLMLREQIPSPPRAHSQLTPVLRGWNVLPFPAQKPSRDYLEVTFSARGIFLRTFLTTEYPPCSASAALSQESIDFLLLKYINVIKVRITQPGVCDLQLWAKHNK